MSLPQTLRLSQLLEVWESFSGWYWFVTEYHENGIAFGLVKGFEIEWGYFDLKELRRLSRRHWVWKVHRQDWEACPCVIDDSTSCSRALPAREELKGGNLNMEEQNDNKDTATMCPTKAGNGYKVVVNGVWFYASKQQVMDLVSGKQKACTFHTIKDEQ